MKITFNSKNIISDTPVSNNRNGEPLTYTIKAARVVKHDSGAEAIGFTLQRPTNNFPDFLSINITNRNGEANRIGIAQFNSIVASLNLVDNGTDIESANGTYLVWDKEQDDYVEEQGECFEMLQGLEVGLILRDDYQANEYGIKDGVLRPSASLWRAFDPETLQTTEQKEKGIEGSMEHLKKMGEIAFKTSQESFKEAIKKVPSLLQNQKNIETAKFLKIETDLVGAPQPQGTSYTRGSGTSYTRGNAPQPQGQATKPTNEPAPTTEDSDIPF